MTISQSEIQGIYRVSTKPFLNLILPIIVHSSYVAHFWTLIDSLYFMHYSFTPYSVVISYNYNHSCEVQTDGSEAANLRHPPL